MERTNAVIVLVITPVDCFDIVYEMMTIKLYSFQLFVLGSHFIHHSTALLIFLH